MEFTAKAISDILNGEVVGDPNILVNDVSKIDDGKNGTLSFLANSKYTNFIYNTKASVVLVNKKFSPEKKIACTLIKVEDPYESFASILEIKNNSRPSKSGIDKNTSISESATLGENLYIGDFAYIDNNVEIGDNSKIYPQVYLGENVKIGKNTVLYSGVKIYQDCVIGSNCIIHSGTIIGSDGFGYASKKKCEYKKIPQLGNVVVEDNVEIGSNCSIDRATMGSTLIRKGAKIDNLVQVAHNVEIGENTVIISQAGIAGSSKIGNNCIIAAQAGIVGHISIADNVIIGAQSGVNNSIKNEGVVLLGSPAFNISDCRKSMALYKRLPDLSKEISNLEKELNRIKKSIQLED